MLDPRVPPPSPLDTAKTFFLIVGLAGVPLLIVAVALLVLGAVNV